MGGGGLLSRVRQQSQCQDDVMADDCDDARTVLEFRSSECEV